MITKINSKEYDDNPNRTKRVAAHVCAGIAAAILVCKGAYGFVQEGRIEHEFRQTEFGAKSSQMEYKLKCLEYKWGAMQRLQNVTGESLMPANYSSDTKFMKTIRAMEENAQKNRINLEQTIVALSDEVEVLKKSPEYRAHQYALDYQKLINGVYFLSLIPLVFAWDFGIKKTKDIDRVD